VTLTLLQTLAASFIWGINTLFLLSAGLSNVEAFAANAFFTAGQVIFEIPTGVVADTKGRRTSFLLGSATLLVSTLLYLMMWWIHAPFWGWAIASILIGLGFTFFSGAVDAWLVDCLAFAGYKGNLESVFAKGQIAAGSAMLAGSVAGGFIAQATNLGVPYILRAVVLAATFITAFFVMKDLGFTPVQGTGTLNETRRILKASIDNGLRNRPVRWMMLAAPLTSGVGFYAFYAMQPYLLELYGDEKAFGIAGLAAAIIAGAQIVGGMAVPLVRKLFSRRTSILVMVAILTAAGLVLIGWVSTFALAVALLVVWALTWAAGGPIRQAFINGEIPSEQRATVLSFDSLMGSAGGVVIQPALGKVADVQGYSASYFVAGALQAAAIPFILLARKERAKSDPIR
jgi:MFS family permease